MTIRSRLLIVSVLGLGITMAVWGWIQLNVLDRILVDQQGKTLYGVAETVATYYRNFPTGRGLSALEDALSDHIQANSRLARIDIISVENGEIEYISGVGRIPYEWNWSQILAASPSRRYEPNYMKLTTDGGPALGLLLPVPPERRQEANVFVGVIIFSQGSAEILARAQRLLFFSSLGLLFVILLVMVLSYGWLIGRPLHAIIKTIDEFQTGQYVKRISLNRHDELGQVASHFDAMAAEIERVMASNEELTRNLRERVQEATLNVVQLQKQVNQLQQLTALGHLTATLAHDLGTPLHSIAGLATLLLERGNWPADVGRKLELIVQQTRRLNTVIQNVRRVTRLPEPHLTAVSVAELLRDTLTLVEPLAQESGMRFQIDIGDDLPPLYVDRYRVQTALFNLVENGLEAMERQGVISIRAYAVPHPLATAISVGDTGAGIPTELLARVCEPFFSTREDEGLRGLGLAIVQDIVKAHGGRMEIESRPGEGTRVILYFPVVEREGGVRASEESP
jgi:two-component system, NtrC family, sensor kinase